MKALITGASSGFGWDMAHVLSDMGYDIIAVARRKDLLEKLKLELKTDVEIICCDLSDVQNAKEVGKRAKDVEVFINNAGFGVFGKLTDTPLESELKMIQTNIQALHIMTKIAAQEFYKKNHGYILNVASLAAFFPGPLFGGYYASKSYVLRLSQALLEEIKKDKKDIRVSVLCPGPAKTEFGEVAKVSFYKNKKTSKMNQMPSSEQIAKYAILQMFSGKAIIIPGKLFKMAAFFGRFLPDKLMSKIIYYIQSKKCTTP